MAEKYICLQGFFSGAGPALQLSGFDSVRFIRIPGLILGIDAEGGEEGLEGAPAKFPGSISQDGLEMLWAIAFGGDSASHQGVLAGMPTTISS